MTLRSSLLASCSAFLLAAALVYSPEARAACNPPILTNPENDCDVDGQTIQQGDCDDQNAAIKRGSTEICDAFDNDCDGVINEGLIIDADSDGVRACGTCQAPAAGSCDCDDTRSNVKPGQAETCDFLDNDCDALIDERNPAGDKLQRSCYPGPPGTQGVGVCAAGLETCNATVVNVPSWAGCTATLPSNPPANPEPAGSCNGIDNDCDGVIDDGLFVDADGDGSRLCGTCGASAAPNCDCNDTNGGIRPGAAESCNGVDDDCDSSIDEGVAARICYGGPAGTFTGICPGPTCNARGPSCVEGTQACSGGSFGTCSGDTWPVGVNPAAAEGNCNGIDDDCDGVIDDGSFVDADGDGVRACGSCGAPAAPNCDCNDSVAAIRPGVAETCDNVDNDCDGSVDEALTRICYEGPPGTFTGICPGGTCNARGPICVEGTSTCAAGVWGTCAGDDWPVGVNPAAAEPSALPATCGVDDDCDGTIDDGLRTDADGDGSYACGGVCANAPPNCDCNDANGNVRPGRPEICNGIDDDCDGLIDEGLLDDTDGDGYRQCGSCAAPAAPNCDCNDTNAAIHPGATEICNDCVDQDCDGARFNGFPDSDGDGVPNCAGAAIECNDTGPNGNLQHGAWCNIAAVVEVCDALDNDCDTLVDERDTSGNKLRRSCYTGPPGTSGVGLCVTGLETCNAAAPPTPSWGACVGQVVPVAETCGNGDEDCDGTVDDGFVMDVDGDGYRACNTCQAPGVPNCDCNDNNAAIHPGATEACDSIDQDCDGQPNDVAARVCFVGPNVTPATYTGICPGPTCDPKGACVAGSQICQTDGTWGTCLDQILPTNDPTLGEVTCDGSDGDCDGTVDDGNFDVDGDGVRTCDGDCNDSNAAIHPGAPEICDNLDNDCNGSIDGASTSCYTGPAGTNGVGRCHGGTATCVAGQPSGACTGEVLPSNTPTANETICNGTDDDCDGQVDDGFDADGDGAFSCALCSVYSAAVCDCDDADPFRRPGAREICDCADNNCTGGVDEGGVCVGAPCFDFDADGFTNCQGDCDDHNGAISPARTEVVGNGVDDDCDGALDENVDEDGDGFSTGANDCNDNVAAVNPGAPEVCDGFDNDCDGAVDEGFDVDGDLVSVCAGDCNDANPNVNPFAPENCANLIDDNCDGYINEPTTPNGQPRDDDNDGVTLCQGDCNDHNPAVHAAGGGQPVAPEICDGVDNDCDGFTDEGFDVDGDFVSTCFGDCNDANPNVSSLEYERPSNGIDDDCDGLIDEGGTDADGDTFTPNCGDCNDADPNINPHATEACDRVDNNCDSFIDSAPGQFDLCATCFDSDGDGVTNCEGDCNDNDDRIYRGAVEVCDGVDNDCDGAIDLDAFGLRVCEGDGGFDAGSGDGGVDGGTDGGTDTPDGGGPVEELPPEVLIGCGCSAGSQGGGMSSWLILGTLVLGALGRMRGVRRLRRVAAVATVSAALVVTGTGCDSLLRYHLDDQSDGGSNGDGGPDDPILLSPEWKCDTQTPAPVRAENLPGSQIPLAVPQRFTSTIVGGDIARVFEDEPSEVAAFALRRDLPSDISPLDRDGAETIGVRELAVLSTLTGTPLVADATLRFNRQFIGPTFSNSYRIEFGANTDVYTARNRFVSFFSGRGLGELGQMPRPASGTQTDIYVLNVMYRVIGSDLIIVGAITPDTKLAQNQSTLLDFSDGSAVGPVGSVLSSACEHKTLPSLQSDFIFVVDNSGSMSEEQAALTDAAAALYSGFVSTGMDFRLGVITTDGEVLQGNGFTTDQTQFETDVNVGIGGGTTEQGLEYGMRAVQLARTHPDPDRRLRAGAGVVMVFYSDEESANLMTVEEYADFFNSEGVSCYAIVGPKPSGCSRVGLGNAVAGASYIDVAAATGGTSGSICNPNLSETIQEVLLGALGAASRSPLVRQPVSSTLAVRTTSDIGRSRQNGFDYDPGANTVLFFGSVPPTGTQFQVAYQFFVTLQ